MNLFYRRPTQLDGKTVHSLIKRCPPLDCNSLYCNLLQCRDFAETSIVAQTSEGDVIGFVSGYIPPERKETLFIWQVALDPAYRGQGIALEMLTRLFNRNKNIKYLEATVSPDNTASESLFKRFYAKHHMPFETRVLFEKGVHLSKDHESVHVDK